MGHRTSKDSKSIVKTRAETSIVLPDIGNNREMGNSGPYKFDRYARRGGASKVRLVRSHVTLRDP